MRLDYREGGGGTADPVGSNPALTGFSAPKILWVRENEPAIYERAAHFLLPKDFVRLRLTGEFATDVSDASGTLLFDVAQRALVQAGPEALEIDRALAAGGPESPEMTGHITLDTAVLTGLKAGTPVAAGAGDQAASAVGNGIVLPGLTSATLGTSGVIFGYTDRAQTRPSGPHPHFLPRRARQMARDGRDPRRGTLAALVSRRIWRKRRPGTPHAWERTPTN